MSLKFRYEKQEEVPAPLAGHYTERDGAWILDAEGAVEKSKLDELRTNSAALARERDELKKRFEGIDPDEVRKLGEEKRRLEEAQALRSAAAAGEVEKVLEARVKAARGELEKQISDLASERDALNQRLVSITIDQGVITAATKRGLRATALPDITARARNIFRLVQGAPVAYEPDGQTVRAGKDGFTPMTLEEWIDGQVSEAPHLFEANVGGGAGTGNGGERGAGSVAQSAGRRGNPWRRETWNLTEQMRIQRMDPAAAARMRAGGS
jgi:hypothetical protein